MIETIEWHTLHPRYLNESSRVLDLGANYGMFATAITERFGCNCVAVEPSPEPFRAIPNGPRIAKVQAAVADQPGVMPFHVASDSVCSSLLGKVDTHLQTIDVRVYSLAELLAELGLDRLDLLKVDIEGAEIGMLDACPDELLSRVGQISIEFHDFCGITPSGEVRRVLRRLHGLGFRAVRMSRVGHQDTWLINQRLLGISTVELWFIRVVVRNWKGLKRVLARELRKLTSTNSPITEPALDSSRQPAPFSSAAQQASK